MAEYRSKDYFDPVGALARRRKERKAKKKSTGPDGPVQKFAKRKKQTDSDVVKLLKELRGKRRP